MNLFRADKSRSISLPRKLKTAAYNPDHLATALHLTSTLISCRSMRHRMNTQYECAASKRPAGLTMFVSAEN